MVAKRIPTLPQQCNAQALIFHNLRWWRENKLMLLTEFPSSWQEPEGVGSLSQLSPRILLRSRWSFIFVFLLLLCLFPSHSCSFWCFKRPHLPVKVVSINYLHRWSQPWKPCRKRGWSATGQAWVVQGSLSSYCSCDQNVLYIKRKTIKIE